MDALSTIDDGDLLTTTVAIVGGGPVGTALAIALAQRGVDNVVIERHHEPQPVPKGQNLTQRTMEHFRSWGIEHELRSARTLSANQKAAGMTVYGTLLGEHRYAWLQRERMQAYYAATNERLPQYATEQVLRAKLRVLDSARAHYGWTADTIHPHDDTVHVGMVARDGRRATVVADWVVGADGSGSLVRDAAGITQTRADHDRLMVLVVFRSTELDRIMEDLPGVSFVNVLHPEFEGYWQFFGRVDAAETWFFHAPVDPSSTLDTIELAPIIARAVGRDIDFSVEYLGFWDLRFTLADAYRADRIFIAGDAAHSHPPYGGYGINTGFEDATNLAWKLAATVHGWAGPGLLDSYDLERRPVFASTRDDFIDRAIRDDRTFLESHDPVTDPERFTAEWDARALGAQREVGAFEPNYEGSPAVVGADRSLPSALGEHLVRARAGHHLAPGTTATGAEVFDALGDGFALLTNDEVSAQQFTLAAQRLGVPLRVVVLSDESAADYAGPHALVRPDQFVAWVGDAAAADAETVLSTAIGQMPADAPGLERQLSS